MRMLTMASFIHDTDRRQQDDMSHVVRSPLTSTNDEDSDEVDELDPIDGFPSPPTRMRPRRRFAKSAQTTYELSFSRRHANARRAGGGRSDAAAVKGQSDEYDEYKPMAFVSSLSHVLTEVMNGKTKALDNFIDTTPPQPHVTYVVEHAADGTPYVAASDGNKYFANSAIGQIFLKPVLNDQTHSCQKGQASKLGDVELGGSHRKCQQHLQSARQLDHVHTKKPITIVSSLPIYAATKSAQGFFENDIDVKKRSKMLLGLKGLQLGKKKRSTAGVKVLQKQESSTYTSDADSTKDIAQEIENNVLVLDPKTDVQTSHADSSWEVTPLTCYAQQELEVSHQNAEIRLLDSKGMQVANQARSDLLVNVESDADDNSGSSSARSSLDGGSFISSTGPVGAPSKPLSPLQPKQDSRALPMAFDAYDADDNPLCRSFQNVRDVDLIRSMPDSVEDSEKRGGDKEQDEIIEVVAVAEDELPKVNVPDFAGCVRASSGTTSVADFVGGFKGQLSRQSGASGLVNRKRSVRHARLTVAEQKAADLARKLREARNRVPFEFRDEHMSPSAKDELQKKKYRLARGRRVQFNHDVLCREFEVESEDDDDGYDSPDEIVDAVQLVHKHDVVHAEDVVAAFSMEHLELPLEEPLEKNASGNEATSLLVADVGVNGHDVSMQDDLLTFSQLNVDQRMSFSDL